MKTFINSIKSAELLLRRSGSRIKLIGAGILAMFAFVLPLLIGSYGVMIFGITDGWDYVFCYGMIILFGFFVTLPAFSMFFTYAYRIYSIAKYGYSCTKKGAFNYFRSLFSGIILFIRPFISIVLIQLSYELTVILEAHVLNYEMSFPITLLFVPLWIIDLVIIAVFVLLTNSVFSMLYYYGTGMSVFRAFAKSCKVTFKRHYLADLFVLLLFVLSGLSVFTFLVGFMLFVIPTMTFTYFELAENIDSES